MRTTKPKFISAAVTGAIAVTIFADSATRPAYAQETAGIPPWLVTPDKFETRIGTLDFKEPATSLAPELMGPLAAIGKIRICRL